MSDTFDVNAYWIERGRQYRQESLPAEYHRIQEEFLHRVLSEGALPVNRVLELGCGFGRITKLLAQWHSGSRITALDLSPDQLDNARQYCTGQAGITFDQYDFYSGAPLPGGGPWDTAIAVEVFLHHPVDLLKSLLPRLAAAARFIINIDWSETWTLSTPEHVWVHDYASLYHAVGLDCAIFVVPQKIDGLQHRLFVAGRELPGSLRRLEQLLAEGAFSRESDPATVPALADWMQRLESAISSLRSTLPGGSSVILINDNQWGCEAKALPGLKIIPFLERNGKFWGPPADDAEALRELDRLHRSGAACLAVAWNSFWWLDHYRQFHQHLLQSSRCLLSTSDLIIFAL